jgi:hypothetical protein
MANAIYMPTAKVDSGSGIYIPREMSGKICVF